MNTSRIWSRSERSLVTRTFTATIAKLRALVIMNTPNTTSANVMLCVSWWLRGSCTSPISARIISPPASGKTAKFVRLLSHQDADIRLKADDMTMAMRPKHTAGAGPSRLIASTSARKAAVTSWLRSVTRAAARSGQGPATGRQAAASSIPGPARSGRSCLQPPRAACSRRARKVVCFVWAVSISSVPVVLNDRCRVGLKVLQSREWTLPESACMRGASP